MEQYKKSENDTFCKLSKFETFIVFGLMIVLIGVIIYLQLLRYWYIGESVHSGNIGMAGLLFSPELAASVATVLPLL